MTLDLGIYRTVSRRLLHGLAEIKNATAPTVTTAGVTGLHTFDHRDSAEIDEPLLYQRGNDLIEFPPSLHTGLMRQLGQHHYSRHHGQPWPFRASWDTTHGLHVQGTGQPWIIEVSRTGGVTAWRLDTVATFTNPAPPNDDSPFGWMVRGDYPEVVGTRRTLLAALGVAGAPLGRVGWAFDYTGLSAVNVVVDGQNGYTYTRLYRIAITVDGAGAPTSATITEDEAGYAWQPPVGLLQPLSRLKAPGVVPLSTVPGEPQAGGLVQSVEMGDSTPTPPAASFVAPVYAYYTPTSLEVVRWHFTDDVTTPSVTPAPGEGETGSYGNRNSFTGIECYSSPLLGVVQRQGENGTLNVRRRTNEVNGLVRFAGDAAVTGAGWVIEEVRYPSHATSTTNRDVLVVPLRDREAVYHYRASATGETHGGHAGTAFVTQCIDGPSAGIGTARNYDIGVVATINATSEAPGFVGVNTGTGPNVRTCRDESASMLVAGAKQSKPGAWFIRNWSTGISTSDGFFAASESAGLTQAMANSTAVSGGTTSNLRVGADNSTSTRESRWWWWDVTLPDARVIRRTVNADQVNDVYGGFSAATPWAASPAEAAATTETVTYTAAVAGSRVSDTLTLSAAEGDEWERVASAADGQIWAVAQDALDNAQLLYSTNPVGTAGTFGATLAGSAAYDPAGCTSDLLAWVGRP